MILLENIASSLYHLYLLHALRDDNETLLDKIFDEDLGWRFIVLLRQGFDHHVIQRAHAFLAWAALNQRMGESKSSNFRMNLILQYHQDKN